MIAAKTKYFKIKNPETGEFDSFIFIKGDKGWVIGPDQISDETGNSTKLVPSLKLFDTLVNRVTEVENSTFDQSDVEALYETKAEKSDLQSLEATITDLEATITDLEATITDLEATITNLQSDCGNRFQEIYDMISEYHPR